MPWIGWRPSDRPTENEPSARPTGPQGQPVSRQPPRFRFDTAQIRTNDFRLPSMTTEGEVAVLDYGSQYSQLIVRRVRELGFVSHLYAPERLGELKKPGAIILSGGPRSTSEKDAPDVDYEKLKAFGVPVLGVCY